MCAIRVSFPLKSSLNQCAFLLERGSRISCVLLYKDVVAGAKPTWNEILFSDRASATVATSKAVQRVAITFGGPAETCPESVCNPLREGEGFDTGTGRPLTDWDTVVRMSRLCCSNADRVTCGCVKSERQRRREAVAFVVAWQDGCNRS